MIDTDWADLSLIAPRWLAFVLRKEVVFLAIDSDSNQIGGRNTCYLLARQC